MMPEEYLAEQTSKNREVVRDVLEQCWPKRSIICIGRACSSCPRRQLLVCFRLGSEFSNFSTARAGTNRAVDDTSSGKDRPAITYI
jgi:hypothetical protein